MRKIIIIFLLLAVNILIFSQNSAKDLNKKGYNAYLKKDYKKAKEYFLAALIEDDDFLYAHHNYACVLSLTWDGSEDILNIIVKHLERTLEINPERIKKILSDSDLNRIRNAEIFLDFILDGNRIEYEIFQPAPGSCAAGYEIKFYNNGIVEYYQVWEGMMGDETANSPSLRGRYAIKGDKVIIYFPGAKKKFTGDSNEYHYIKQDSDFISGKYKDNKIDIFF